MPDWKEHGVRIVRAGELDPNTPQSPGMTRAAAITHARTGASKLWAGTVAGSHGQGLSDRGLFLSYEPTVNPNYRLTVAIHLLAGLKVGATSSHSPFRIPPSPLTLARSLC